MDLLLTTAPRSRHDRGMPDRVASAALAAAARRGDRRAFAALHERYGRMVHAILLARGAAGQAEDLVQDVFLAALEQIADLRDAEAFGGWLAQIARRRAVDHLRARRPHVLFDDEERGGRSQPPGAEARAAVLALPETYRETLLMRLVEGMSGAEIAARTGLTPGGVRVNLHRGMELLRARLGAAAKNGTDDG
jgi:RNA polymerase sigma-70 factor (ECF subfamily)